MLFENPNYAFAGAFVDELARCGLTHVCICPGSRSTPLTVSFARHAAIRTWVHLDERSASYFALGMARALGEPVALVCTSGTAAANFYPAVVEARYGSVPLLLLTADRPPELWDWGANQSVDQQRLYGSNAKWSVSMPLPEATTPLMAFVRSQACRAFATSLEPPAGPVHLNFPFREPLEPVAIPEGLTQGARETSGQAWQGRDDGHPFIRVAIAQRQPSPGDIQRLAATLHSAERGIIVCGPQHQPGLAEAVTVLARRLNYPVLADPLSQVRCSPHDGSLVIDSYDTFLRDPSMAASLAPEVVLRFGAAPTSKTLGQYIERHRSAYQLLVGDGGWNDPFHASSEVLHVDPVLLCAGLASAVNGQGTSEAWISRWRQVGEATREAMMREVSGVQEMFEGKLFTELADLLPDRTILFVGNSMPVRDLDTFFPATEKHIRLLGNRGASGIDGVLSTALGAAAVSQERLMLVLGDLSFYHDMNGLLAAKAHSLNATIIVINNDGGAIFSFLPQADYPDVFEPYFGTPHGLTFRHTAALYGLGYQRAEDWSTFRQAVMESLTNGGTTIIEVPGDRAMNVALHRQMEDAVAAAIHASVSR